MQESHCSTAFFVCQRHPTTAATARVGLKYAKERELPKEAALAAFCFPVPTEMHVTKRVAASEVYAFTMTGDRGDRAHGFCRKIFWSPNSRSPKFPIVLCIVSDKLWSILYYKAPRLSSARKLKI